MPTTDGFSSSTNSLWFELLVAPVCGELLFVPIEPYPTPLLPDGSVGFYYMILCDTDDSHLQSTKGNPNETNRRGNRGCSIDAALWSSCNLDLEMNAPNILRRVGNEDDQHFWSPYITRAQAFPLPQQTKLVSEKLQPSISRQNRLFCVQKRRLQAGWTGSFAVGLYRVYRDYSI